MANDELQRQLDAAGNRIVNLPAPAADTDATRVTTAAPANVTKAAAAVGTAFDAARSDHKHDVTTAAPSTATGTTNTEGTATSLARSDHVHRLGLEVLDEGTLQGTRPRLNFIGAGVTAVDNAGGERVDVTIPGGGSTALNSIKDQCICATTGNITLSGLQTIDTVVLAGGERVLVKDQTAGAENGIYVAASGAWTRATDFDTSAEVKGGVVVAVTDGDANNATFWLLYTIDPITLGTTALVWVSIPRITTGNPDGLTVGQTAAPGTGPLSAPFDHSHAVPAATPVAIGTANAAGSSGNFVHSDHVHDHGAQTSGTLHAVATTSVAGFLSSGDKGKLDNLSDQYKASCFVATTANITLSGTQTIDGVALTGGERVLVKNQSTGAENGIYLCAAGAWTRTTDFDTSAEVKCGLVVNVERSDNNLQNVPWELTTQNPITLGTTALVFFPAAIGSNFTPAKVSTGVSGSAGSLAWAARADHDHTLWDIKKFCRLATIGNHGLSGLAAIDGVTPVANDRILVKNQTTGSQNGIYSAASGAWARTNDADVTNEFTPDFYVLVSEGTQYAATVWVINNGSTNPTVGTTTIVFIQLNRPYLVRRFLEAGAFRLPVTADAAVNAFADLTPSSLNSMLLEQNFDDTTEQGVIWQENMQLGSTRMTLRFKARPQTANASTRTVGLKLYYRRMQSGVAVSAWANVVLTDFSVTGNASSVYLYQEQQLVYSALGTAIVPGDDYQFELTRINPVAGTELVGDWNLQSLKFTLEP